MKEVIVETLAGTGDYTFTAPVLYYETVEEGDKAAGKEGAILHEANLNLDYRGARQDVRNLLVELVQEMTKVKPLETATGEKDEKGNPVMEVSEKDGPYVKRALAQTPGVTNEMVQKELTKRAKGYSYKEGDNTINVPAIAVDIKGKTRGPSKPPKLPGDYLETANAVLSKGKAQVDKVLALINKDLGKTIDLGTDATKTAENLGWALREHTLWRNKQSLGNYAK